MNRKGTLKIATLAFVACAVMASCKKENGNPALPEPSIDHVEVGTGNNGIGVIGRDFHFEADVVAGERIETVQIRIVQRADETYEKDWEFEITWEQYSGARNTNVHKHFTIPADAPEGKYDFLIIVNDQNGTRLEEVLTLNIYLPENLPVDPQLSVFNINKEGSFFYRNGKFTDTDVCRKDETIGAQAVIGGVKGDGIMYMLLINKQLDHRPETVDGIDFSKAIVYDVYKHEGWEAVGDFSNFVYDLETFTTVRRTPPFTIGAADDNNTPQSNPISGEKAWKSGDYLFGVVYTNTTHNSSFYHYIDIKIEIN